MNYDDKRSKLTLNGDFRRGNKLYVHTFNESSTMVQTQLAIRHAFVEGFTCFLFKFQFHKRKFEDRFALPPGAGFDERDALELGEHAFNRFTNTVQQLIAK